MAKKNAVIQKKRRKRKANVTLQKIGLTAAFFVAAGLVIYGYHQLPMVKVNQCIEEALDYEETKDYENALASYEKALAIESGTVKAYRYMANLYLDMQDYQAAEEILRQGLQETKDQEIQETWLTVKYNESVKEINEGTYNFNTVKRLVELLRTDERKEEIYELMEVCYDRLRQLTDEKGINRIMLREEEGFGYGVYQDLIKEMLSLYQEKGEERLKQQLIHYLAFQADQLAFFQVDFQAYRELVKLADQAVGGEELKTLLLCLEEQHQTQLLFAPLLEEFAAGNYEAAREFLVKDEYVAIRDAFIHGQMEYWKGETYIPVSNIGSYLHYQDGKWGYSFMDGEAEDTDQGYIKVWGFKWLDNGHQRTALSYIPPQEKSRQFPMTEYCMMYWWSTPVNMELTVDTYARMNFRFEENTYTEDGKTTKAINDWGGKYEYKDTYE